MSKLTDGGPAFPEIKTDWPSSNYHDTHSVGGMTLRDYFAAKAISVVYSAQSSWRQDAENAYLLADAMLKAREE